MKIENGDDCLNFEAMDCHLYNSFKRLNIDHKNVIRNEAAKLGISIEEMVLLVKRGYNGS